ncbi:MAG TPA: DUF4412 domain-containing protein [Phaeodactylibacter sp.]|nr:DUF4412 domain-containing protein [Phaeodactylibacter sp.]
MAHLHNKSILIFFVFLCSISFISAQKFEGIITIKNTKTGALNAVFTIKKEMAMVEATAMSQNIKMIKNSKTGEKITITNNDGETVVIVKNTNDMQYRNLNKEHEKRKRPLKNLSVRVTRETKKINGYKCYKVVASDGRMQGEAWITKKLKINPFDFFPAIKKQQNATSKIAKVLQNSMDGFVIEMTIKDTKTKKIEKMTASIQKKKIDKDVFVVDMEGENIYNEEKIRELMKEAQGNPAKMRKAKTLLAQIRM